MGFSRGVFGVICGKFRHFASITLVVAALSIFAGAALAQDTGTFTGTITDPKGLAMGGATVLLHNNDTGVDEKPVMSGDTGLWTAPLLAIGTYDITVSHAGFATVVHKAVTLQIGQTVRVDFEMPVATQQSLVTVTTEVPVLETEKTDQSQNVSEQQVKDLPVESRRWESLALLSPGTVPNSDGSVNFNGISNFYNQNSVDGANNNDSYDEVSRGQNNDAYVYSGDSIREFQVKTDGFNAELGQSAGGSVNAATKSGTNSLHGDMFYNGRSAGFNANDPFAKSVAAVQGTTVTPAVHQQDQWGGSIGGRVIKDKLFFFVTEDSLRKVEPTISSSSTSTPAINSAAFVCPLATGTLATFLAANPGVNQMPNAAQCQAAKTFAFTNIFGVFPRELSQNLALTKLDYQMTPSNHISGVFDIRRYSLPISSMLFTNSSSSALFDVFFIGTLTSVIGSDKVNEFRIQWAKDTSYSTRNSANPAPGVSQAFTYGNQDSPEFTNEYRVELSDNLSYTRGTHTFKTGADLNIINDDVKGSVTSTVGSSYTNTTFPGVSCTESPNNGNQTANTEFCDWLLDLYAVDTNDGSGLNGMPGEHYNSYGQTIDTVGTAPNFFVYNMPFQDLGVYVQDTWKARPNITVNYGLRSDLQLYPKLPNSVLEVFGPAHDLPIYDYYTTTFPNVGGLEPRLGVAWNFRKTTVLRFGGGIFYAATAGHNLKNVFSGAGESSASCQPGKACINGDSLAFDDLIVNQTNSGVALGTLSFPGLPANQEPAALEARPQVPCTAGTAGFVGGMCPMNEALFTNVTSALVIPNTSFSIRGDDPHLAAPRAIEANLGIEQQLPHNINISIAYNFTRGEHIPRGQDANITTNDDLGLCTNAAGTACGVGVTKPYYIMDPTTGLVDQTLSGLNFYYNRIAPTTGGIPSNTSTVNTVYHALVAGIRVPTRQGLQFQANYTYSHAMDTGGVGAQQLATVAIDPFNQHLEYGNSSTDVPSRFVGSVVYSPPFTKMIGNKILKEALDGWSVSSNITATNGTHFTGSASGSGAQSVTYCTVAAAGCSYSGFYGPGGTVLTAATSKISGIDGGMSGVGIGSTGTPAGSRAAWIAPGLFELPSYSVVDFRLSKTFAIKERYHVEIRGEAFNLFNSTLVQGVTESWNYTAPGKTFPLLGGGTGTCPATSNVTCMTPNTQNGQISNTGGGNASGALGSRQMQAGVRFEF